MDLNAINANINRLLTNIWNLTSFLKEYTVDGGKDVSITHVNADGSETTKTFPNITKQISTLNDWKTNLSTEGTFTATLHGRRGDTVTGTVFTKTITGQYHLLKDRVFIDFPTQLINGSEGTGISVQSISGLPFESKLSSTNGTVYGRGLIFKYAMDRLNAFMATAQIGANSTTIILCTESTERYYSGSVALRSNNSASFLRQVSINYKIKV